MGEDYKTLEFLEGKAGKNWCRGWVGLKFVILKEIIFVLDGNGDEISGMFSHTYYIKNKKEREELWITMIFQLWNLRHCPANMKKDM